MQLIDARYIINRITEERRRWGDDYDVEQVLGDIEDAPTIDAVEVVHAHWEKDSYGMLYCSRCGRPTWDAHDVPIEFNGMKGLALVWPYYCGFCGAKMNEEDTEQ